MYLLFLLLISIRAEQERSQNSSQILPTPNPIVWPEIIDDEFLYVTGFTSVVYSKNGVSKLNNTGNEKIPVRKLGYRFGVKIPSEYQNSDRYYPVVVFLHGGKDARAEQIEWWFKAFYSSNQDPYILLFPAKKEWEWSPRKIFDVIEDVQKNMRIDKDRIYLTGLSMGGRGTYIVAAKLPHYFAALMPLSPHHQPYSYLSLASKVSHLPIWMSHGTADKISSYDIASQMAEELKKENAYIKFRTIEGGEHRGWRAIYRSADRINWLLSQTRNTPHNYELRVTSGIGSGYYEAGDVVNISGVNQTQQADLESWSSNNGGQFENPRVQSTKFVMPAGDVEVHFGLDSNQQFKTKN